MLSFASVLPLALALILLCSTIPAVAQPTPRGWAAMADEVKGRPELAEPLQAALAACSPRWPCSRTAP
jgi:hypothetical protein